MTNTQPTIAFFGTSVFAVSILDALKKAGLTPTHIITAPDTPQGRKLRLSPPPVKVWAQSEDILCTQPQILDDAFLEEFSRNKYTLCIVAAYGKILPKKLLHLPAHGTLNVHPSLLPLFRGASPLQYQILEGVDTVGVTIMLVDEKMDHGPILAQEAFPMPHTEKQLLPTCEDLSKMLSQEGGRLLTTTIPKWIAGEIAPQEQDHKSATYTKPIKKKDALIRLRDDSYLNYRKIRAFTPHPGAYYFHATKNGKEIRVKIIDAHLDNNELVITRVVPEGKKEMDYNDFLRGLHL